MPSKDIKKIKLAPKKSQLFYLVPAILFLLLAIIAIYYKNTPKQDSITVNGQKILVERLLSEASREKGLSGREYLPINNGLLFVYENTGNWKIWMKDMNFAIDIIWLSNDGTVVGIKENVSPDTYPEIHQIDTKSKYILEINSGIAKKYDIKIGDKFNNIY
jgi:uncharacterized membrane protein (UPF0127 family)